MPLFRNPLGPRLVALTIIVVAYLAARLPGIAQAEKGQLAADFRFQTLAIPSLAGYPEQTVRAVHPDLTHISAWISSVGAAVALADLDGDGLPNDICYVNTGINQVIVTPAPGGPARYEPFPLDPAPLPYAADRTAPMGCLPGDFNEDGRSDILVYYWGRTPIIFLRQTTGKLAAQTYLRLEVAPGGERWFTNAATQADFDGDGHIDLIIGNYFADGADILNAQGQTPQHMQHSMSRAFNGGNKHLLLWAGATAEGVAFIDASSALPAEVVSGWTLALGAADLDGDLLPELYIANDFGPDRLLHNRSQPGRLAFALLEGRRSLTTPKSKVLGHDSFKGMGVDFGDVNGDGQLDIYVSNIADDYALEESHFLFVSAGQPTLMRQGIAPYIDQSEALGVARSGWGWDTRLVDLNNDGALEALQATGFVKGNLNRWPELHELAMGNDTLLSIPRLWPRFEPGADLSGHNPNPFFVRAADGRYYDIAAEIGLNQPLVTRGIAAADVDGDGALDLALANQWDSSYFYHNACPACGAFLGLRLLTPTAPAAGMEVQAGRAPTMAGYPAIGAQATVSLPDGRRLIAQVDGGNGHSGVRSPEIHLGLGAVSADTPLPVTLTWRDAAGQPQHTTLELLPGWHTILLGRP